MLNMKQIHRLIQVRAYRRLVQRIMANGRCQSPHIMCRLLEPGAAAPAALGLALQRLGELTWGPSLDAHFILDRLLTFQSTEGLFRDPSTVPAGGGVGGIGDDSGGDSGGVAGNSVPIAATAIALRAMCLSVQEADSDPDPSRSVLSKRTRKAIDHALVALGGRLKALSTGRFDEVDAAVVLWQLADLEFISNRLNLDRLAAHFSRQTSWRRMGELFEYAHASAA